MFLRVYKSLLKNEVMERDWGLSTVPTVLKPETGADPRNLKAAKNLYGQRYLTRHL